MRSFVHGQPEGPPVSWPPRKGAVAAFAASPMGDSPAAIALCLVPAGAGQPDTPVLLHVPLLPNRPARTLTLPPLAHAQGWALSPDGSGSPARVGGDS